MNLSDIVSISQVERPAHPLPRRYIEPIIFLAHRMASMDKLSPPSEQPMVNQLTDASHVENPKQQSWFRDLNDNVACDKLELDTVKRGALVILCLVMKSDTIMGDEAKGYFSKIRGLLEAEPVTVPVELEDHKKLAISYLREQPESRN